MTDPRDAALVALAKALSAAWLAIASAVTYFTENVGVREEIVEALNDADEACDTALTAAAPAIAAARKNFGQ